MSVIHCDERRNTRRTVERDDGTVQHETIYYVQTDSATDGRDVVLAYVGLPQMFDAYSLDAYDPAARVVGRDPRQLGPKHWDVMIRWDSRLELGGADDPEALSRNPLDWRPKVSVNSEQYPEIISKVIAENGQDYFGPGDHKFTGVTNSAGEPFDPPLSIPEERPVIVISRNEAVVSLAQVHKFNGAVNSAPFQGASARQLRLKIFVQTKQSMDIGDYRVWYYPVTYRLQYRRETWDLQPLNKGTYYLDGTDKKAFLTEEGQPFIGLLDADGGKLAADADPTFQRFRGHRVEDFNAITPALPQQLP